MFEELDMGRADDVRALFTSVFSDSEGEAEGLLVGNLAWELLTETDRQDIYGFAAVEGGEIIGCIIFSRLTFECEKNVFILSPVAIRADRQGQGLGQGLINFGIDRLREQGIVLVMTYGDPDFYVRVGFRCVAVESIRAPFDLKFPHGWLGRSLPGGSVMPIPGRPSCVRALNKAVYW